MQPCYKTLFVFFLSAAFFISAPAQYQNKIDSLMQVLKTAKEDTNKVNTLNELSKKLYQMIDYEKSKKYAKDALQLAVKINYEKGQATAYCNIGNDVWTQGNVPVALENYMAALKIGKKIGAKKVILSASNGIANVYAFKGNYPDALKYYFDNLKINEELGDKKGIWSSYINIGLIYKHLGNYAEALKTELSALKISEELGEKYCTEVAYNNIALIYEEQGNYSQALKNAYAGLKIAEEIGDKHGMVSSRVSIGNSYSELGNYNEGVKYQLAALKILEEIGDKGGICTSYINLGADYIKLNNFSKAKKYLSDALSLAKAVGNKDDIEVCYSGLTDLDSAMGNYKQALEHYKLCTLYKDSLLNETSNNQVAEMQTKYESEKKDKEIIVLNKDKEIQNIEIKKQTLLKNSFIGGLALALILFFLIYKNYRTRQKLILENIRNNIAADLHDDIGSTLNSISLFSEVAKQEAGKPIPALDQIGVSARKIIDAMSDIVWTINPENDTFENVIVRMRSLAYLTLKAKGIEFIFKADESLNQLSLPMLTRKNIYLLFKEATNNIVKYSNASRASFHLSLVPTSSGKNVKMAIRDNGVGFNMENALMGNGIKNMKRRSAEIGAQFLIESSEGNGTNIELNFIA